MSAPSVASSMTSIIDNREGNTLHKALDSIVVNGEELWIATAFFSLDALNLVGEKLQDFAKVRLLFGDDASKSQRKALLDRMRVASDRDLLAQRLDDPFLGGLAYAKQLIDEGRLEARCYTRAKFHAKAYISHLPNPVGPHQAFGILGSGNFTRPGLEANIELNAHLTPDQTQQLIGWYRDRWEEAEQDEVTLDLKREVERHLALYDPYLIYQRALIAWGSYHQGNLRQGASLNVKKLLDPHQDLGYQRALEILNREHGVMICDGVGLGKSFIALALIEHYCLQKKNVLLIAPKSIMEASWRTYLEAYLDDLRHPFGTILEKTMTDLGFEGESDDPEAAPLTDKQKELQKLVRRVDVVVIDESHNFRKTDSLRYDNLKQIVRSLDATPDARKKVILLTATPINTHYADLSAQLALIAQDYGTIGGYESQKITSAAKEADNRAKKGEEAQPTLDLEGIVTQTNQTLSAVLESVVIQRKRSTCIDLAQRVGKQLIFPHREPPQTPTYDMSDAWKDVVRLTHKRFEPTAAFLKSMKAEYKKAEEQGLTIHPPKLPKKSEGIKFAAFLPEQYRLQGEIGRRSYQVEVFLAGLVFTNTLKQLESSPAAFQGILQSLGTSLVARLRYVLGERADADIEPHTGWITTPIHALAYSDGADDLEYGENVDINGEELDEWLEKAISARHLHKKLAGFAEPTYDVERWRKDILSDLAHLQAIHKETMEATRLTDFKLAKVVAILQERLAKKQRVVIFTQSQRTSFYLEKALLADLPEAKIARIDSNVKQDTRQDILYAFCPGYNPKPPKVHRDRVDILISTDVLSEGVNMQEAECILNYDIHWNPVRLIQRIGRVDRRLDPAKHPKPHSFSIVNFLPPDEINDIIKLVDTVEGRTTQISKTLGIDQAFFKATDPAGTLKEFNALLDGESTATDRAHANYVELVANPDPETLAAVEAMPPGAFGVWEQAPVDGVFGLFEMVADENLSATDRAYFRSIIGMPVLALETTGKPNLDAPAILGVLSATVKGVRSGPAGDPETIRASLRRMKSQINQSFAKMNLVAGIQPRLICSMELRHQAEPRGNTN